MTIDISHGGCLFGRENRALPANAFLTHVDYFILATHHRNDDRISLEALKKGIPYVGVVASAKKTGIILDYLKMNGVTEKELEHFYAPTGLELNAKTPEQIALSILSEMVMLANGGSGKQKKSIIS